MKEQDKKEFLEIMVGVSGLFGRELSKESLKMYFMALEDLTIEQVKEGVSKHTRDTDSGQFMPKPADIIKHVTGTTKNADDELKFKAESQWQTVMRAISECGSYRTPIFKNPITAACVSNFGWPQLCGKTMDQLTWAGKEFVDMYQNYSKRPIEQLTSHVAGREDIQQLKNEQSETLQRLQDGVTKRLQ